MHGHMAVHIESGLRSRVLAVRSLRSVSVRSWSREFGICTGQAPDTSLDTFEISTGQAPDTSPDRWTTTGRRGKPVGLPCPGVPALFTCGLHGPLRAAVAPCGRGRLANTSRALSRTPALRSYAVDSLEAVT